MVCEIKQSEYKIRKQNFQLYMFTSKINEFLHTGGERNSTLRKNVLFSAILKVIGLCTSLLIIPITINYLNNEVYGVWMTMSSILYWFAFFDIGLGNGMRNYLTEAISLKDFPAARSIISTTLLMLTAIAVAIGCFIAIILYFVNLNSVFNTFVISGNYLYEIMLIASIFTLITFVVKNIGMVFTAMQKYAINDLLVVTGNVLALIIIYILTKLTAGNLLYIVLAFTTTPVLIFLISSIFVFVKHPELRPALNTINYKLAKKVITKGFGFFLIQITSCIVIFGSSNLFIAKFCGPADVTVYNIAFKYFNLIAVAYTIVLSPLWSAYTDAFVKDDLQWIKYSFYRSLKIWIITVVAGLLMLAISGVFYKIWIGSSVHIPFTVSLCVLLFICSFNFNNCVTYLLNGVNKIRIQICTSFIFTVLFLLAMVIWQKDLNIEGISICMTISYFIMSSIHFYQCNLLINKKAKGIWNK